MENKNMAFDTNIKQEVELTFDQPKEILSKYKNEDGSDKFSYLYGIKRTVNGENAFFATAYLNGLIQDTGAREGTRLSITKTEKTVDGEKRLGWDVKSIGGDVVEEQSITEVINKVASSMDANKPSEVKELSLEEKVNIMWGERSKDNKISNTKDDLPF